MRGAWRFNRNKEAVLILTPVVIGGVTTVCKVADDLCKRKVGFVDSKTLTKLQEIIGKE